MAASLPASPEKLFDMYLDATWHTAFTGLPVTLEPHAGGVFRAFDGDAFRQNSPHRAEDDDRSNLAVGKLVSHGNGLGADAFILAGARRGSDRARSRQRSRGGLRGCQPWLEKILLDAVA